MKRALFAAIGLAAAGCLGSGTLPTAKTNEVALYGPVPIIRPGSDIPGVGLVSDDSPTVVCMGMFSSCHYLYPGGLIVYPSDGGKRVGLARLMPMESEGRNPHAPLEDAYLELKLKPGMSASQVETILGAPKYGVERALGNVELVYPERAVAVEYAEGVLVRWQRTVV